ncbi:MFS transporter [Methylobacterium oryzihabitans]|uniref:MFS transporter n=1 Tax=Methylobacterium oryzihabitans TaxID=2499852 RepID=A0A3S2V9P9_9HYPH|nr:MFS transporter [Methylobacterium oryzihabitans]RVU17866.1 MFS transporter [Methylobacterium oryzihabitans]
MDRLPWSRFHLMLVIALGVTWILDGLEVTIVGAIGPVLQDPKALGFSVQQVGLSASFYVVGAVVGALVFGWLTDRYGRRLVFYTTLAIYIAGVIASALAWDFWSFALFRLVTGLGIGGEYAAINSAIDELIPAKYRGRVDLIVNGSFWVGAAAGAGASLLLLDPAIIDPDTGWRLGFGVGGVLGLGILFLRRHVPESPRWLVTHGRQDEAERTLAGIERRIEAETGRPLPKAEGILKVHPKTSFGFGEIFSSMLGPHRGRSLLALVLMIAQAFLFNAVFFTYGLVLAKFYGIPETRAGIYLVPLAIGNFMGPLLLGHLFDTVGRRRMIAGTFLVSGVLLAATAWLFALDVLTAWTQTAAWIAIFFFASAAASSAYLTASEIFPLETRALAIAVFYALGTGAGGVVAPWLFTRLIETGMHGALAAGYAGAALLLAVAAFTEWKLGVDAEGKSLEDIADPLSKAK